VNKTGVLDSPLPASIAPTVFVTLRHTIFWVMLLLCAAVSVFPQAMLLFQRVENPL